MKDGGVLRPKLGRISLLKRILQGYRVVLDERLQPYGITTSQLRMLWMVEAHPLVSGAKVARLCSVTPQTGQATMTRMEEAGWITRRPSAASERVLVAELTASGKRLLRKASETAESLDRAMWAGMGVRELAAVDAVLQRALEQLGDGREEM